MKKLSLIITIAVFGLALSFGTVSALPWEVGNPVTIGFDYSTQVNSGLGGYGGLFTVTDTASGVSINTFCLELDEYIYIGHTYYVADVSNDTVWKGGRNTDSGDQISDATKWLYVQYLEGFYTNAAALQLAIWVLEEEYHDKTIDNAFWGYWGSVGSVAKSYYEAAQSQSTTADIRALDLKDGNGNPVQSYLIRVPEPSTLLLLGAGLVGIGIAVRRRNKR